MFKGVLLMFFSLSVMASANVLEGFETDTFSTTSGELKITFIGHGSLLFTLNGKYIYADPFGKLTDFSKFPKADLILITHEHYDHFDPAAIKTLSNKNTFLIFTEVCMDKSIKGTAIKNGDIKTVLGLKIEAVPAYNIVYKRDDGKPFHPKGTGNGYVITFGNTRIYIAGDTENIPEMKQLKNIDVAFLPVNLPYTMTPEMATEAASLFNPKILYPYHFGETDISRMTEAFRSLKGAEVRIRKMK
jgi:L-ascorbate metabolism protein UlaG (beta-lactamase superfamily)